MKKMSLFFATGVAVGATLLTGCSKEVMDQRLYKDDADAKKGEIVSPSQLDPMTPVADTPAKQPAKEASAAPKYRTYKPMETLESDKIAGLDENYKPAKKAQAVAGKSRIYRVRRGDTLGGIAYRHKVSLSNLMKANNLTDKDAKRLRVGQKLTIPAGGVAVSGKKAVAAKRGKAVKAKSASKAVSAKLNADGTYAVQRGDSPERIARKFKVKLADLLKANNLDEAASRRLQIGQKLIIPTAGAAVTAPAEKPVPEVAAPETTQPAPQTPANNLAEQLENTAPGATDGGAAIPEAPKDETGSTFAHAVQEEEIALAEFAVKYNVSLEDLKKLNPNGLNDPLKKNEIVNIPLNAK